MSGFLLFRFSRAVRDSAKIRTGEQTHGRVGEIIRKLPARMAGGRLMETEMNARYRAGENVEIVMGLFDFLKPTRFSDIDSRFIDDLLTNDLLTKRFLRSGHGAGRSFVFYQKYGNKIWISFAANNCKI